MKNRIYDVIILGAGPAGLVAGALLSQMNIDFLLIEKGESNEYRDKKYPYNVSYGIGGAGLFSDGKISYAPSASKLWSKTNKDTLEDAYNEVRNLLKTVGVDIEKWNPAWTDLETSYFQDIKKYKTEYLDDEKRKQIIELLKSYIFSNILTNTEISNIDKNNGIFYVATDKNIIYRSKYLIISTGKCSPLNLFSQSIKIPSVFECEMGVRVEANHNYLNFSDCQYDDYKKIKPLDSGDEIRTFCTCKKGNVVKSIIDNHITYNGERNIDSDYGNIGIVVRSSSQDSIYSKEMIKCYKNNITKEINLSSFKEGESVIGMQTDNIIKKTIDEIIINSISGRICGPEIERYGFYPCLDENLSVNNNIFFAGDSTGMFRGLLAALISGAYVALKITGKFSGINKILSELKVKTSSTDEMRIAFTAQSKKFFYCKDVVCEYTFKHGMLPINPFRVFDYFLSDRVDRDLIRQGNNKLIKISDELWVFGPIADGVLFEIMSAKEMGRRIRFFTIGTKVEDIKEIDVDEVIFEPEVHSKQVTREKLISFIKDNNVIDNDGIQIDLFNILKS